MVFKPAMTFSIWVVACRMQVKAFSSSPFSNDSRHIPIAVSAALAAYRVSFSSLLGSNGTMASISAMSDPASALLLSEPAAEPESSIVLMLSAVGADASTVTSQGLSWGR